MMHIIRGYQNIPSQLKGAAIAIGNFDGVHLGHQDLLRRVKAIAQKDGAPAGVMSFEPHPRHYFTKKMTGRKGDPMRLVPLHKKLRLLRKLGLDVAFLMRFNDALAAMEAEEFIERVLIESLAISHVVTGRHFIFGHQRGGNAELLKRYAEQGAFTYDPVEEIDWESPEFRVQSSERSCCEEGHRPDAATQSHNHEQSDTPWTASSLRSSQNVQASYDEQEREPSEDSSPNQQRTQGYERDQQVEPFSARQRLGSSRSTAVRSGSEQKNIISSTRIRTALAEGDVAQAAQLLGRPYTILGRVIHGDQVGRTIGFPTANIPLPLLHRPKYGVYAVRFREAGQGDAAWVNGVANLGLRPTVRAKTRHESPLLEMYGFDFESDLYGKRLEVQLAHFIRAEQRFDGLDALKAQIKKDCVTARQWLEKRV